MPLGFLNNDEQVHIPVGGEFSPGGMIGQWLARVMFGFWTETDPAIASVPIPDLVSKRGRGWQVSYKNQEQAQAAGKELDQEYAPKQTWVYSTARAQVLNVEAGNLAKFGEVITFDHCQITSLQSKKYRHELHMIALPAAVHAAALALGYKVPDVSFNDLITQQAIFDDAFYAKLVGTEAGYEESQLWLQRVGLWAALDEKNARAYYPAGSGTKYDATSKKLSECLGILTNTWKSAQWARVVNVPDPRVDAIFGDESKRLTIPALTEIFANEAAAKKVATEELAKRAEREAAKGVVATPTNGQVAQTVPQAWAGYESDYAEMIANLKKQYAGKPKPVVQSALTQREGELNATAAELLQAMGLK